MGNRKEQKTLSIYIHIPFCVRKCLYCDFLSAPAVKEQQEQYVKALSEEIRQESRLYADYTVTTVFLGGGTPSLLPGKWIEEILDTVYRYYKMEEECEISMEVNPGTVTEEKLLHYRRAGVNRLSIGLQSAVDSELKALGRIHSSADFFRTYELIIKSGFNNINVDIMSAIPGQSLASYQNTLTKILSLDPPPVHLSAYSLIIEEGTPFYEHRPELPDEDTEREMYKITNDILSGYGYRQYEISNYAKPGYECRHNQVYWRRGNYAGFGIGAASLIENERFSDIRDMESYVNYYLKQEKQGLQKGIKENRQTLSVKEQMEEFMFLGLRMMKGVSREEFFQTFGVTMEEVYPGIVEDFCRKGLLRCEICPETGEERISLTGYGMDVSNLVMAEFLLTV